MSDPESYEVYAIQYGNRGGRSKGESFLSPLLAADFHDVAQDITYYVWLIANANRTAQILRGEGEGKKTRILVDAFGKDPEFFAFYRSMEAYGKALGENTTMVLSPDSEFFRYFNTLSGRVRKGK